MGNQLMRGVISDIGGQMQRMEYDLGCFVLLYSLVAILCAFYTEGSNPQFIDTAQLLFKVHFVTKVWMHFLILHKITDFFTHIGQFYSFLSPDTIVFPVAEIPAEENYLC